MQPALVHKLEEEYTSPKETASKTHAVRRQILVKGDGDEAVPESLAMMYRSATATCMYMMQ